MGDAGDCSNAGNFNAGKSLAVNDHRYRFPYFVSPENTEVGAALAASYTNCEANALCVFITIPEPTGEKELTVNYKFKSTIRTLIAAETNFQPDEYYASLAREVSNVDGAAG